MAEVIIASLVLELWLWFKCCLFALHCCYQSLGRGGGGPIKPYSAIALQDLKPGQPREDRRKNSRNTVGVNILVYPLFCIYVFYDRFMLLTG